MKRTHIKKLLALLTSALLLFTAGCANQSGNGAPDSTASLSQADASTPAAETEVTYSSDDTDTAWSEADATAVMTLKGSTADVSGSGAQVSGSTVTITSGGLYVLSGSLDDGQIIVAAPKTDTVRLILNGVSITSNTSAAIYASQADKLILTLAEGTANTIADAHSYTYADADAEEPDAAIFAKCDLTINGTGSLNVTGNFKNGIGTKDDLVIVSGTYDVTAANDALRGRDSVTVLDGDLTLAAGGDGIQSNNDEDSAKGFVFLENGTFDITAGSDGIQAETVLTIQGGQYAIIAGGGHASATTSASDSTKGMKAGGSITVLGGSFTIDSADDAVHSNEDIAIADGTFTLTSGDDGIHADSDMTVSGGVITITTCYEGMEASTMTISDGEITITSTDDGINLAGGNGDGETGRFGGDQFSADKSKWLLISGGTITINAGRDAIDSNGNATMTGGTVKLTAAMLGEGDTIDVNGTWSKTGGELTESGGMGGLQGGMGGGQATRP